MGQFVLAPAPWDTFAPVQFTPNGGSRLNWGLLAFSAGNAALILRNQGQLKASMDKTNTSSRTNSNIIEGQQDIGVNQRWLSTGVRTFTETIPLQPVESDLFHTPPPRGQKNNRRMLWSQRVPWILWETS